MWGVRSVSIDKHTPRTKTSATRCWKYKKLCYPLKHTECGAVGHIPNTNPLMLHTPLGHMRCTKSQAVFELLVSFNLLRMCVDCMSVECMCVVCMCVVCMCVVCMYVVFMCILCMCVGSMLVQCKCMASMCIVCKCVVCMCTVCMSVVCMYLVCMCVLCKSVV